MTEWKHRAADRTLTVQVVTTSLLLAFTVGGVFLTRAVAAKEPLVLWPGLVLSAVACAVLLRRRSHPLVVLLVTTACIMAEGSWGTS